MKLQYKAAEIEDIKSATNPLLTADSIGMITGLVILIILLTVIFVYVAYFLPWWSFYNCLCTRLVELSCCNCLKCFFYCPCMDDKAYVVNQKNQTPNFGKMFIQDMFAAPDGSIIHLSDMRAINGFAPNQSTNMLPRFVDDFNPNGGISHESGLI